MATTSGALAPLATDAEAAKVQALTAVTTTVDTLFGIGEATVPKLEGDAKELAINYIESKVSGPAALFLKSAMGIGEPFIDSMVADLSVATAAELKLLQHQADTYLAASAK